MGKRVFQKPPENPPGPSPSISPEMVHGTWKVLEAQGLTFHSEGGVYVPTEKGWKLLMKKTHMTEEIIAKGHSDIKASNIKQMRIIKKDSPDGDDVIAVKANRGSKDFSREFKHWLKEAQKVEMTVEAYGKSDKIVAYGSPALILKSDEIIITKSDTIKEETVGIMADKSANELNQELVDKLRFAESKVKITFEIK